MRENKKRGQWGMGSGQWRYTRVGSRPPGFHPHSGEQNHPVLPAFHCPLPIPHCPNSFWLKLSQNRLSDQSPGPDLADFEGNNERNAPCLPARNCRFKSSQFADPPAGLFCSVSAVPGAECGMSENTIAAYRNDLGQFLSWLEISKSFHCNRSTCSCSVATCSTCMSRVWQPAAWPASWSR